MMRQGKQETPLGEAFCDPQLPGMQRVAGWRRAFPLINRRELLAASIRLFASQVNKNFVNRVLIFS